MKFEAPAGIVAHVAGSENTAFQTHAALEVKTEIVDRPSGTGRKDRDEEEEEEEEEEEKVGEKEKGRRRG